jgi:hypothetical protein
VINFADNSLTRLKGKEKAHRYGEDFYMNPIKPFFDNQDYYS